MIACYTLFSFKVPQSPLILFIVAQRFLRKSPESSIKKTRAVYFRQPRKSSPLIRKKSPIRLPRDNSPSPSFFFDECSKSVNDEIFGEPPSDQDNYVYEQQTEEIEEIKEIEENTELGSKKKRRSWETNVENVDRKETERRLRKISAKGHKCTKCDHFRLPKYFKDISNMVCISCLDICFTCSLLVVPPPLKKARHPQCSSCNEKRRTRKKNFQRLSMQAFRLEKKK